MAFVDKTIEVDADVREVYDAWTAYADYPEFMETIEVVTVTPEDQLHWVAVIEGDPCEWDADVVEQVPDEKVSWRACDGRETGEVRFEKLPATRPGSPFNWNTIRPPGKAKPTPCATGCAAAWSRTSVSSRR